MPQPENLPDDINSQLLYLQEELSLQQVLLKSIDDSVQDRSTAELNIQTKIQALRVQYQSLCHHVTSRAPKYHASHPETIYIHDEPDSSKALIRENSPLRRSLEQTYASATNCLHPVQLRNSRKRCHSEYSDDIPTLCETSKLRRTSPAESSHLSEKLLDSDINYESEKEFTGLFEKQQRAIEERLKMEKLDEEYARVLQKEIDDSLSSSTTRSNHSGLQQSRSTITDDLSRLLANQTEKEPELFLPFIPKSPVSSSYFDIPPIQQQSSYSYKSEGYTYDNPEIVLDSSSNEDGSDANSISTITPLPSNIDNNDNYQNLLESSWVSSFRFGSHQRQQQYLEEPKLIHGPNSLTQKILRTNGPFPKNKITPKSKLSCKIEPKNSKHHKVRKSRKKGMSSELKLDREETPEGLVNPLYEHQKIAVAWLKAKEESTYKGSILADDMGLGKTISALALILMRPSSDPLCKTTLIIASVALIRQWEREIRIKIKPEFRLSTIIVHGSCKKPSWDELRRHDIALTTYGTLASEFKRFERWKEGGQKYCRDDLHKVFPLVSPKSLFHRVILDEAQFIKNRNALSARACVNLKANYRLCLTGTPMMNEYTELYSVIRFLRIRPYNEWSRFEREFSSLIKMTSRSRSLSAHVIATRNIQMENLQRILESILLRRTKDSLIDGKPIINLPPKSEEVHHVTFDEDESAFYHALQTKTRIQFNKYVATGSVGKNYSSILVLLLRLRQACCHPYLIHDFEEAAHDGLKLPLEKMTELAQSLQVDVVERLLSSNDAFECPICYDGVENPKIITPCGHDTCAECLAKITDQEILHSATDASSSDPVAKCPTCRQVFCLSNVIDYAIFKGVHKNKNSSESKINGPDGQTSSIIDFDPENENELGFNTNGDLRKFLVQKSKNTDANERSLYFKPEASNVSPKDDFKTRGKASLSEINSEFEGEERGNKHLSLAMLHQQAKKSTVNRRKYFKYLQHKWQPSAKITKCVELIQKFLDDDQKILIFSQFVSLLDLLQIPIEAKKWKFLRYDGGMSADSRNAAVHKFFDTASHNILLLSLKAGNAGLNLVAASRVIILDPFWNPFIEMQAIDRAYRIGQKSAVEVHRILVKDTVEDRIVELQERKRHMFDAVLNKNTSSCLWRLDELQLGYLLGANTD